MSASDPEGTLLTVQSDRDVCVAVYDGLGQRLGHAEGSLELMLPPGLFRVQVQRGPLVESRVVDHAGAEVITMPGPAFETPALVTGAATSHAYYSEPAERLSTAPTCAPLGQAPHASRLFVFLRRQARDADPPHLPSERLTIHDGTGRLLATLCPSSAELDDRLGYLAFCGDAAPGTYRLRAERSARELAITVPAGRAAHVFIADDGRVRLDDVRVALRPRDAAFDRGSLVARASEAARCALRRRRCALPGVVRAQLTGGIADDLCFGLLAAHVLLRSEDPGLLDQIMAELHAHGRELPDVQILAHAIAIRRAQPVPALALAAPPLLRASLVLALHHNQAAGVAIDPRGAINDAARRAYHDSVWCTWSTHTWDERWLEPTVETLREALGDDAMAIAREMGVPHAVVQQTLHALDTSVPRIAGAPARAAELRVPGYLLGRMIGRGSQGRVYRATRELDGNMVALKVVPLAEPARAARDLEHLRGLARLTSHRHVQTPSRFGVLTDRGAAWMELELCRGSALDLVRDADAPLDWNWACGLVLGALDGLVYLHGCGIAHGNLKPGNLLVRADDSVVIGDLDSARPIPGASRPRTAGLFPGVAAPPGAVPAAFAEDLRAMAETLYFLLTLERARERYSGQTAEEAADNPIVPLTQRAPEIPDAIATWIQHALARHPPELEPDAATARHQLGRAIRDASSWPGPVSLPLVPQRDPGGAWRQHGRDPWQLGRAALTTGDE